MFPCWDEPAMKAFFNISVQHSGRYIVFSNTPIRRVDKDDEHDIHVTYFKTTAAISPSSIMITIINDVVSHPIEFAVSTIWYREEVTDLLHYTRNIIESVRDYLSLTTDVQEKKRRTNLIMIPNNPLKSIGCCGLYLYREQDFTYDEKIHFSGRKIAIAKQLAHNIARRWFLGVVSPSWWTDSWLGEALAVYFSHYTVAKMKQDPMYIHLFVVQTLQPTFRYDVMLQMQSIAETYEDIAEIDANEIDTTFYFHLSNNKGAIFIRMLQNLLGVPNFREVVDRYVSKYKSSSATINDFWKVAQAVYDKSEESDYNIKETMHTWLKGKQYPVLYLKTNFSTSKTIVSASCEDGSNWIIPVTYSKLSTIPHRQTVHVTELKCSISDDLDDVQIDDIIILNHKQVGYYRVNYDNKNWRKISSYLRFDNYTDIHVLNRAAFIDDVYYFMTKDEVEISVFFDIMKYFKRETDFVAWYPMFNILSYLSDYFENTNDRFVTPHILDILSALIKNIGYDEKPDDDDMKKSLRLLAVKWACKLGYQECRKAANSRLDMHIKNPVAYQIVPYWKDWVYCTGMEMVSLDTWHQMLNNGIKNKDLEILMYLTCCNEDSLLLYYLNFLLVYDDLNSMSQKKFLDSDERFRIFNTLLKRHVGKEIVFRFVLQNYKNISLRFGRTLMEILGDAIMNMKYSLEFDMIWEEDRLMELFVVQNLQTSLDSDVDLEFNPIIYKDDSANEIDALLYTRLHHKKGYYRVNYDHRNWYRISSFLQFDNFLQIPVLNRAQLISDAYYFMMKGDINSSIFLNIIQYLKREKDFIAWHPIFNILSYMSKFFEYSDSNLVKVGIYI
ncbi:Glutamyl aminopeptidase [Harpegnathos saltator]|uniref:Glutamyl aminopeptidase n=1 Tax=Harpegnathos saltator TaxID=610380 RepID=E2C4J4_HARSA|nr:Glutamyl aminopeptidase [Harpegnathos saltator]